MTAYYNEIDPYCAKWLRNLMREGLIADGHVDTRSIQDVTPNDLAGFTQCHFFAGFGGWSGALRLAAWPDHRPVWTGSCPCQPFSLAGRQGGFADERHLWPAFRYLIAQCGPASVLGEQVASAADWLGLVRGDLEALGYAVGAMPIEAASAGADHLRDRFWFVGERNDLADGDDEGSQRRVVLRECSGERIVGPHGVANAERMREPQSQGIERNVGGRIVHGGETDLANAHSQRGEVDPNTRGSATGSGARAVTGPVGARDGDMANGSLQRRSDAGDLDGSAERSSRQDRTSGDPEFRWVLGADGKARRVKPGIRLLAHGVPNRVAKLRALGNAIDLRPATAFIKAVM